jgi:hypothetical protein
MSKPKPVWGEKGTTRFMGWLEFPRMMAHTRTSIRAVAMSSRVNV